VRNGKGLDLQRFDHKRHMAVDDSDINTVGCGYARREGSVSQPDRQAMAAGKRKYAADMVTMLVGDQNPAQVRRITPKARETPQRLALPETAIDHQAGCTAFDQQRIACAAAPERRKADHCNC
jgi:hypothetical protein